MTPALGGILLLCRSAPSQPFSGWRAIGSPSRPRIRRRAAPPSPRLLSRIAPHHPDRPVAACRLSDRAADPLLPGDRPGALALPVPSLSDSVLPCALHSEPPTPGLLFRFLLHVYLPATGIERDLDLALLTPLDPRVS